MKRKIGCLMMAMGVCITLTGCGMRFSVTTVENEDAVNNGDRIVVGVSQVGSESVWRTANTAAIQRTFTNQNGYFLIFDNARQKQENQIKAIRSFISQQVDYIIFSPIMEDGWDTVLKEAKEAGIPVVLMDRQLHVEDDSLYTAWVGSDFRQEGVEAGNWLEQYLEEQGRSEEEINIVVLQGTLGSSSETGRTTGFNSIVAEHDNWNILEQIDAEYTTAKGREEMEKLVNKYPDIDVLVSQNDDMTFGALEVLDQHGITHGDEGDVIVISFDAVRSALELVQEGLLNVDVECNPEQAGKIEEVIQLLERQEAVEKKYYVEEKVFTKENISEYIMDRTY